MTRRILILASLPEDGWAYVREGEQVFFIRPPYATFGRLHVDLQAVALAVTRHEFIAQEIACETWEDVHARLRGGMREARAARGEPTRTIGRAVLEAAPRDWLESLLGRVEDDYLSRGRHAAAKAALDAFVDTTRVREDATLFARVKELQQRLKTSLPPRVGMLATVRNRRALISSVQPFDSTHEGRLHLVTVEYTDPDGPADDQILWEREVATSLLEPNAPPDIERRGPMPPAQFDALVRATRWTALSPFLDPDDEGPLPRLPVSAPFHGALQVEDFQLVPLLKALQMPRIAMLLADDVGLGKTIEAGLVLSELLLRRRIRRVLILCPASLRTQWRQELMDKFSLPFEEVDRAQTHALRKRLGLDASPWRTHNRIVASYHYLRQPDVLESFRAACATPPDAARLPWDLLIVDEAHHLAPAPFGQDSDLARMLGAIAPYFEHKLFLSATPHNGHTRSFTGLLEYLDPVRFSRASRLSPSERERVGAVLVRRLKREINASRATPRFCERQLQGVRLALHDTERALSEAFQVFRKKVRALVMRARQGEQRAGAFAVEILGKRLLSSPSTFADSWHRYLEGLRVDPEATEGEVLAAKRGADEETPDDRENDSRAAHAARTVGAWMKPLANELRDEIDGIERCLDGLGLGRPPSGAPRHDARFNALRGWIEDHLRTPEGHWRPDERLVIFTEFKTTLDALQTRLGGLYRESGAVRALYGGLSDEERDAVRASFNDPADPVRVLVATDAASEGLNLQETARYLLHYDVPWNPSRLEQRNGRLDRHGQARDVTVHHFETDDDADLKFIARVVRKVHAIREDLGSVGEVFDAAFERRLLHGEETAGVLAALDECVALSREDTDVPRTATADADAAQGARELAQLEALAREIDLDPDTLRDTLDVAMSVGSTHPPPHLQGPDETGRYRLKPPIPAAWAATVDESLRIHGRERQGALRALTFDARSFLHERGGRTVFRPLKDTSLLHLGHPMFHRALTTFARLRFPGAEDTASRWAVRRAPVPDGVDALLVLTVEELAVNELRETFHHWVRALRVPVTAGALGPCLPHHPARDDHPTDTPRLTPKDIAHARDLWLDLARDVKALVHDHAARLDARLRETLAAEKDRALADESERFKSRHGELSALIEQQTLASIEREVAEREAALRQLSLFAGEDDRRRRELDELRRQADEERARRAQHYETLRALLHEERGRVLDRLLPRRYTLRGSAQAFPVAVEIRLPSEMPRP